MIKLFRPRCSLNSIRSFTTTISNCSGHNKWSSIKHDKAKNDAERNKLFNKFANQVALAVKLGGSTDPIVNIRLATAIEQANKNNVTKRVIENAIKKGSGATSKDGAKAESCVYEGMGPGGVAFVVEALTDNKNRTIGLVRSAFSKANGSMTPTLYFFDKKGYVVVYPPKELDDFDKVFEKVLEVDGVEDLEQLEQDESLSKEEPEGNEPFASEMYELSTEPSEANRIASSLKEQGFRINEVGLDYVPKSDMAIEVADQDTKLKLEKFMRQLDEIDDVTDFYTNVRDWEGLSLLE